MTDDHAGWVADQQDLEDQGMLLCIGCHMSTADCDCENPPWLADGVTGVAQGSLTRYDEHQQDAADRPVN